MSQEQPSSVTIFLDPETDDEHIAVTYFDPDDVPEEHKPLMTSPWVRENPAEPAKPAKPAKRPRLTPEQRNYRKARKEFLDEIDRIINPRMFW